MSFADEVTTDSPTNWWRFEDTSGTNAVATTGAVNGAHQNSPTLAQPGLLADGSSTAVVYNGTNQETQFSNPANFLGTTFSFELLFTWTSGTAIARDNTNAGGWIFGFDNASAFNVRIAATTISTSLTTAQVRDGNRHHMVITFVSGGTNQTIVYMDGVQVGQGTITRAAPVTPLHLSENGSAGQYSATKVDEMVIYATELSSARVTAHYAAVTAASASNPRNVLLLGVG